ncbi:MAG: hypothetical protein COZ37_00935 [bacterium (Candidatus Ratteibacteria) CG_4_10_14_3_um_filter_41_18]|uniref:Cell division protein ZapA n=4 Tax=Candidatus Ratteibacteria TaxID=2979319 RepID=A0A2M7E6W2_9BACT|nr:MAG: hypothetical protein AUJ76_02220 [Candidatus Omnitrophica bacterium CG1_02_41_171]PIV63435.1 MAG: hypothetical protein COS11_07430 [bacterium (Candidatus Ratteibacteria) CG01_land_8_20_14_3_00_40_19]PIW31121.1 MAG: hypothetical protein COW28_07630 [bacterium (Candidatus Ratteibacteria) CG15_BIG_FIL_POST_REV_8_21_14_020_41_12]PIW73717.1 MAG: hypothetical protein CO004_04510 [bacterium (Candidatus Ratteibacteria) CG_4_8_14_3_um_filter_41_36]PIX77770.1 MAG: hypothetical protein COZ37_00935
MREKGKVEITIFGSKYILEGDKEYASRLADYINQKINERLKMSPDFSSLKLVVTTLLSVSDELFTLKDKRIKEKMESKYAQKKVDELIESVGKKAEELDRHVDRD